MAPCSLDSPAEQGIPSESPELAGAAALAPMAEQNSRRCGTWVEVRPEHTRSRRVSDSSLSALSHARPGPRVYWSAFCPCPRLHPATHSGLRVCKPVPEGRGGSASLPPPSSGRGGPWTGARSHPRTPGAQSHAHPATEPRSPASTHAPPAPVTRVAARTAPDSPARSWGRVSGWQVSPSETGFLGAPRCPTFLPRFGLPLPLPPLSVLLAAASAPPPGLRHSAWGPRRWDALEAREAGTAFALRWRAAPPLPAAPVPERGTFLIGRSHPPGEGSSQP